MKKLIIFSTCIVAIFLALSFTAFAEESPTAVTTTTAITSEPAITVTPSALSTTSASSIVISTQAGITLDAENPAYPLFQMVEGIKATKSINANGDTEIIISVQNISVGEMEILTAKTKDQIMESITKVSYDTELAYIDSVDIVAGTPEKVDFKITGVVPDDVYDQLVLAIVGDVGKTLIEQASSLIDSSIQKSEKYLKKLKKLLRLANKRYLTKDIKSIQAKMNQTATYLNQLDSLKISVDTYKDDYLSTLDENSEDNSDEDDGDNNNGNHDGNDKNQKERHREKNKDNERDD